MLMPVTMAAAVMPIAVPLSRLVFLSELITLRERLPSKKSTTVCPKRFLNAALFR